MERVADRAITNVKQRIGLSVTAMSTKHTDRAKNSFNVFHGVAKFKPFSGAEVERELEFRRLSALLSVVNDLLSPGRPSPHDHRRSNKYKNAAQPLDMGCSSGA